jgi:hypothetical protein
MVTSRQTEDSPRTAGTSQGSSTPGATSTQAPVPNEPAKLADDFQPNEPAAKSGVAADGQPDDSLSPKQLERAATEALHSLRPQPSATEVERTLEKLAELDPKTGQPVNKVKTAKEASDKAVSALNEIRGA